MSKYQGSLPGLESGRPTASSQISNTCTARRRKCLKSQTPALRAGASVSNLIFLSIIILLAVFLRLYQLPTLPPGLNFDEAGNGVAALDILAGNPRLWWPIGGGKEPLWPYLIALSTTILGNVSLSLRLPAAMVGILTIPAVYRLMATLFHGHQGRVMAVLTALGLALSSWHLHFSRLGFRAVLLPLFSSLAFYFLWRSFIKYQGSRITSPQAGSKPHALCLNLILASLFTALAIYAYLAGRLLPLVPILFVLLHWLISKVQRGETSVEMLEDTQTSSPTGSTYPLARPISNFLFLLFLCLIPLIVYFSFNPADLFARSGTVSIFNSVWNKGDLPSTVWRTLTLTLNTYLGLRGDANPLVNLPGQPVLPLFLAPFFVLGLLVSLYRVIGPIFSAPLRPRSPAPPLLSPHLFLLCWWTVMLLPAILAPEGAPHHLRLIGTIVPTYTFVAIGVVAATNFLIKLLTYALRLTHHASRITYLLPATCYLLLALQTYTTYFVRWPVTVDFTLPFDLYALRLAHDIAQAPPDTAYVLPMDIRAGAEARHYTLDYLLAGQNPSAYTYVPVDERNAERLLAQAAQGKAELRVVSWTADKHTEADAKEIVTYLLETNARQLTRESFPVYDVETYALVENNSGSFNSASRTAFTLPEISQSIGADFGGLLRLDAAFVQPSPTLNNWLPVALTLTPLAPMEVDYKISVRLVSPAGERLAQKDRTLMHTYHQGTSLWPPEAVNEYFLLPVPFEAPPGVYDVTAVIYHPATQAPLLADGVVEVPLGRVKIQLSNDKQ